MLFNVVNEKGLADYNSAPFSPLRHLGKFLRAYYARSECLVRFVGPLPSRHVNEINFCLGSKLTGGCSSVLRAKETCTT
jgi:hypothetical protein